MTESEEKLCREAFEKEFFLRSDLHPDDYDSAYKGWEALWDIRDRQADNPKIASLEKCARSAAAADGEDRSWPLFIDEVKAVLDAAGVKYHE